ncbi:MAG: DUF116 domain-containing protein [Candidatus Zixiibacteriota bacterium]
MSEENTKKYDVNSEIGKLYLQKPKEIFPGKGLFLGLSWVTYALIVMITLFLFYLITPRLQNFGEVYFFAIGGLLAIFLIVLGGGLLLISLSVSIHKDLLYPHGGFQITMRILPPVVIFLGKALGVSRDALLESIIDVQNSIFLVQRGRVNTKRILMLLPHCLQHHECNWKITWSVENCKRCGKCPIGNLCKISDRYGISLYVATGGTVARRVVKEVRPTVILAVACPRDLASGMVDVYPIPVFGILNKRPNGPCFDTIVDTEFISNIMDQIFRSDDDKE